MKKLDGSRREANNIDSAFTPQVDTEVARLFEAKPSDADVWDSQLESDVTDGELDDLRCEAQREHRAGRTKPL
jgi:hypothetical protein